MIEIKATSVSYHNGSKVEKLIHSEAFHDDDFGDGEEATSAIASFFANIVTKPPMPEEVDITLPKLNLAAWPELPKSVTVDMPEPKNPESYGEKWATDDGDVKCDVNVPWSQPVVFSYLMSNLLKPSFGYDLVEKALQEGKKIIHQDIALLNNSDGATHKYKVTVTLQ